MDTKIPPTFWSDPSFDQCAPEVLLAAVWIKTNDRLNLLGCAEISPRIFEFQARVPFVNFERACQALGEGLVRDGNHYWLRDFIREQIGSGLALVRNNMRKPLLRALTLTPSPSIRRQVLEEYPELSEPENPHFQEGAPKPQEKRGEEKRGEEKNREEQSEGGAGETPPKSKAASIRPAQQPEPVRSRMVAVAAIMRRGPESAWSEAEKKAMTAAGLLEITQEDFDDQVGAMHAFYRATIPEAKSREFWRRTTLPILLNNWPSELDKARAWRRAAGGQADGVTKVS